MKRTIPYLLLLILAISCQEGMDTNPGDLEGYARINLIYDYPESYDSIQVLLENNLNTYSTLTDSSGAYVLQDVETGTYRITFSKEGFNDHVIKSFLFYPAGIPVIVDRQIQLYEIPLVEISNDSVFLEEWGGASIYTLILNATMVELKEGHRYINFRAFFSTDPNVDFKNHMFTQSFNLASHYNNEMSISISLNVLDYQFDPGEEVYVKFYPTSASSGEYSTSAGYLHEEGYFVYTSMNQNVSTAIHKFVWPEDMQPYK